MIWQQPTAFTSGPKMMLDIVTPVSVVDTVSCRAAVEWYPAH